MTVLEKGRVAATALARRELRRPTSSLGHADRAMKLQARDATRRLQKIRLSVVLACQDDPAEVMAGRQAPLPSPPPAAVTAEELEAMGVVFAPRNQDTGDLGMDALVRHSLWEAHDEDEAEEEALFEGLYPHLAAVPAVVPSQARLPRERAPSDDSWVPGAKMPAAATRCRWHNHVREVRPDSDEASHAGLPSDEDEFGGRALSGAALLW